MSGHGEHDDATLRDLLQQAERLHFTPADEACLAELLNPS
jgi:hypothetical protein